VKKPITPIQEFITDVVVFLNAYVVPNLPDDEDDNDHAAATMALMAKIRQAHIQEKCYQDGVFYRKLMHNIDILKSYPDAILGSDSDGHTTNWYVLPLIIADLEQLALGLPKPPEQCCGQCIPPALHHPEMLKILKERIKWLGELRALDQAQKHYNKCDYELAAFVLRDLAISEEQGHKDCFWAMCNNHSATKGDLIGIIPRFTDLVDAHLRRLQDEYNLLELENEVAESEKSPMPNNATTLRREYRRTSTPDTVPPKQDDGPQGYEISEGDEVATPLSAASSSSQIVAGLRRRIKDLVQSNRALRSKMTRDGSHASKAHTYSQVCAKQTSIINAIRSYTRGLDVQSHGTALYRLMERIFCDVAAIIDDQKATPNLLEWVLKYDLEYDESIKTIMCPTCGLNLTHCDLLGCKCCPRCSSQDSPLFEEYRC
jgi:hypothetical protein